MEKLLKQPHKQHESHPLYIAKFKTLKSYKPEHENNNLITAGRENREETRKVRKEQQQAKTRTCVC